MSEKRYYTRAQAKGVGEQLGVDWKKIDLEQFRRGMDVELEHGLVDLNTNISDNDPLVTGKIALAHLNKIPDYYDHLEKMKEKIKQH